MGCSLVVMSCSSPVVFFFLSFFLVFPVLFCHGLSCIVFGISGIVLSTEFTSLLSFVFKPNDLLHNNRIVSKLSMCFYNDYFIMSKNNLFMYCTVNQMALAFCVCFKSDVPLPVHSNHALRKEIITEKVQELLISIKLG